MSAVEAVKRSVAQLAAAEWLVRQPLERLPQLVWFLSEDGTLVGHPAETRPAEARAAFEAWAAHLRMPTSTVQHRGGVTRLRAQREDDGVRVTIHAELRVVDQSLNVG